MMALLLLSFLLLASLAVGVSSSSSGTSSTNSSASTCSSEVVWVEEGPYFVDGMADVSNVIYNQTGIPLNISIVILDGRNTTAQQCIPLQNVKVDIWNCNWDGVYSDESSESTLGVIYLRGYQLSNSSGGVMFQTVYPGWYAGRTPHVHFRFRVYDGANSALSYDETLQMFFDDAITAVIYQNVYPYTQHPGRDTYNNDSTVYTADNQLALTGSYTTGYQSTILITIPLGGSTSNYILGSATNTGNGASGGSSSGGGGTNTGGGGGGGAPGGGSGGGMPGRGVSSSSAVVNPFTAATSTSARSLSSSAAAIAATSTNVVTASAASLSSSASIATTAGGVGASSAATVSVNSAVLLLLLVLAATLAL